MNLKNSKEVVYIISISRICTTYRLTSTPHPILLVSFRLPEVSSKLLVYVYCPYLATSVKGKDKAKDKIIPVTGSEGPWGCETLRLPHFLYTIGSQMVWLSA
jgi:hypothetical protein